MIAGIVNMAHDASLALIDDDGNIDFASSSERYCKIKHHTHLSKTLLDKFMNADTKVFYEDIFMDHKEMFWLGGKHLKSKKMSKAFWTQLPDNERPNYGLFRDLSYRSDFFFKAIDTCLDHHRSHAAATFYTRPWESYADTVIMSLDGASKDTFTSNNIYTYDKDTNTFENHLTSNHSIGQFYSEVTERVGYHNFEEGTVMGLSCYGEPEYYDFLKKLHTDLFSQDVHIKTSVLMLGERNIRNFCEPYFKKLGDFNKVNMAASLQKWAEEKIMHYAKIARQYGSKLCYSGGVAQNILANSKIRDLFDDMWITSDPTDGGNSLGCAAWEYCNQFGGTKINWIDAYLGHDIDREVNPREVVDYILEHKVCGIANGKAEWGPRALGNRSLIGDVRYDIKDTVNAIKKREYFRPFGPLILEEEFDKWFEGHTNGYMQYVCKPKHDLQSVIHVDGTSRVQTVPANSRSIIRPILEEYFERTGVPMLLNTSLNIKGRPMVNDEKDANKFEKKYNVRVF